MNDSGILPSFAPTFRAGLAEGRREGHAEGSVEGGKSILLGLCRALYGESCTNSLAELLQSVDSLDVLNEVSRGLVERGSADEFLARVKARV